MTLPSIASRLALLVTTGSRVRPCLDPFGHEFFMALPDLTCSLHPSLSCAVHPAAALSIKCHSCRCTVHGAIAGVCASNPPALALQITFYPLLTRVVRAWTLLAPPLPTDPPSELLGPGIRHRESAGSRYTRTTATGRAAECGGEGLEGRLASVRLCSDDVCSSWRGSGDTRASPESI